MCLKSGTTQVVSGMDGVLKETRRAVCLTSCDEHLTPQRLWRLHISGVIAFSARLGKIRSSRDLRI